MYELQPFKPEYIDDAATLVVEIYTREQRSHSHMPEVHLLGNGGGIDHVRTYIARSFTGTGTAAFSGGKLTGFMFESERFHWKGQHTALVDELSHAVQSTTDDNRSLLYQKLYQSLASQWVKAGCQLHIIRHLAHDVPLKETLFLLGFGAILAENVRGISAIERVHPLEVTQCADVGQLLSIQQEHTRYYQASPIFARKDSSRATVLADLEEHLRHGDQFFVCQEEGEIVALFVVGESSLEEEGLLLRQTNTAQVKSAYVRPSARNRGIGSALLQRSVIWARANDYDRIFVEHETANISGTRFWRRYFTPFVYASLRYVDKTL